jgi:hypothetical protein
MTLRSRREIREERSFNPDEFTIGKSALTLFLYFQIGACAQPAASAHGKVGKMPRMRRILGTLAFGIAFVAANAEKRIKIARDEATANKTATEALAERGLNDITSTLEAAKTDKKKLVAASNFFFGAYFMNTKTRAEYCATRGVKIDRFVAAHKQQNHDLLVSAERYQIEDFRDHGYTYDIDKLYKMMSSMAEKYAAQDMKDTASMLKISETEVCQSFVQDAAQWADYMDYRKRVPEGAQILLMK